MKTLNMLLEITIYSGVLFAAIMLLKRCFESRMSPFLHFAVWGLLVARLMMPVTLESSVHLFALPAETQAGAVSEQVQPQVPQSNIAPGTNISDPRGTQPQASNTQPQEQPAAATQAATPAASRPAALSAQEAILFAWLAGAGIGILYLLILHRVLRMKIRRNAAPSSQRLLALFEEVKGELGVRTDVKLVCQYEYGTPAMMFPRTVLMPIDALVAMDDEQVKFALRHELMHFRRGDPFTSLLLSALNAVYWFNPIVWIAFRQIRADMETACDSAVVRRLDGAQRSRYASLIVGLFARPEHRQLVLGMAQRVPKRMAEQRIRGIFMENRSKRSARAVSMVLAAALLVGCFTTACQPTPTKRIVQPKNNDSVKDAIASNPPINDGNSDAGGQAELHKYSAPQTWQGSVKDEGKKITINVDAKVSAPTDTWGLYELIPEQPDKAYLDTILKALAGDAEIYGQNTYKSKSQMQSELVRVKEQIVRVKSMSRDPRENGLMTPPPAGDDKPSAGSPESMSDADYAATMAYLEQRQRNLENALRNAPDKKTTARVAIDMDTLFSDAANVGNAANPEAMEYGSSVSASDGYVEINGYADLGKKAPARISISKLKSGTVEIRFENAGENDGITGKAPLTGEPLFKVNLSMEEAENTARQAVRDMGLGYLDIAAAHSIDIYDKARMEGDRMPQCYAFTFTRSFNGVPATYAYDGGGITDKEKEALNEQQYAMSWRATEALVAVDDSGVVLVEINVPKSDVRQLAEGIELKSFDEIMEIFNRQAIIEGCYSPYGNEDQIVGREVRVDEIKLGYMPTIWKDHPNQLIFVPVWDFFGEEVTKFDDAVPKEGRGDLYASLDKDYKRHFDLEDQAILTINALDGTIMQRLQGPD